MKILLIEDEDFIRDLYKRQLELAGMPTDAFGLGNDGLNAAHQNPTIYNLILLDIMLPDTNGLQILKDLKQNNGTKPIPVILLTNLSQDMLIKEGFELGAEGYLVKAAYTPAQIVQEVKNILAKKATPAAATAAAPQAAQYQPLDPSQVQAPPTPPTTPTTSQPNAVNQPTLTTTPPPTINPTPAATPNPTPTPQPATPSSGEPQTPTTSLPANPNQQNT